MSAVLVRDSEFSSLAEESLWKQWETSRNG